MDAEEVPSPLKIVDSFEARLMDINLGVTFQGSRSWLSQESMKNNYYLTMKFDLYVHHWTIKLLIADIIEMILEEADSRFVSFNLAY